MRSLHRIRIPIVQLAVAATLALALSACSAKSPSEPKQSPAPTPGGGAASFTVEVTANPPVLPAGSTTPTTITVKVRRQDNGQAPPDGTTLTLTTTLGDFNQLASNLKSIVLSLGGGQAQALLFAGTDSGLAVVRAQLQGSAGQVQVQFSTESFFIGSVEPNVGSPQGGQIATVLGAGFVEPVRVTFGGVPATVQSVTSDQIQVVTPAAGGAPIQPGTTRPVTVAVTIRLNTPDARTDSLANGFTYSPGSGNINQPSVFSVTPRTGPNEGGTLLTLIGEGFVAPVQVLFGQGSSGDNFIGIEGSVQSVTASQIKVVTPPARAFGQNNQNQTINILVRNVTSGFATVAASAFQYGSQVQITSIAPGEGPATGGTLVTVFGNGFDAPVAVEMGTLAQQIVSVTGTEIVIRTVPVQITSCNDVSGPTKVVNIETGNSADGGPTFTYRAVKPIISGINPPTGPEGGGNTVTITGLGFEAPVRVLFGDQAATVSSSSMQSITTRAPRFTGNFGTQTCTTTDGAPGTRMVPASVSVSVENLATGCMDEFQNGYTYSPADTTCTPTAPPTTNPPVADFVFAGAGPLTIQFQSTSTGAPTSFLWDFGDGSSDVTEAPMHTYGMAGTFNVTLTVTNADGSDSITKAVTVN